MQKRILALMLAVLVCIQCTQITYGSNLADSYGDKELQNVTEKIEKEIAAEIVESTEIDTEISNCELPQ